MLGDKAISSVTAAGTYRSPVTGTTGWICPASPPPPHRPARWHPPALSPGLGTASREQPGSRPARARGRGPLSRRGWAGLGCWPTASNRISLRQAPQLPVSVATMATAGMKHKHKQSPQALKTFWRGDAFPCLHRAEAPVPPGIPPASSPSHTRLSLARALLARTHRAHVHGQARPIVPAIPSPARGHPDPRAAARCSINCPDPLHL